MLVGIDVGGTYTDGVAVSQAGEIIATAKHPTGNNVLKALNSCLDQLLAELPVQQITNVAISTTMLTNAVLQAKYDPVSLWIMPGPGLTETDLELGVSAMVLPGAMDFRGREIVPLNLNCVRDLVNKLADDRVAICGKFAQRNNGHELAVAKFMAEYAPQVKIELSHKLYGGLNFPRRANSTYLTAATRSLYQNFLQSVVKSLEDRHISAQLYILKGDGGTTPLQIASERPIETLYSGPAASVLGAIALSELNDTLIVMDIGGTTTDLGLILDGKPLLGAKGATIGGFKTMVRSYAVNSLNIGGDSAVECNQGVIKLQPLRQGPAFCLGGPVPTLTDALRTLELIDHGSREVAAEAMSRLAAPIGMEPKEVAMQIVQQAVAQIVVAIRKMVRKWEEEPAYRVWQVLHPNRLTKFKIMGVGGGAQGLTALVAKELGTEWQVPVWGKVANALGAALARPTFTCSLRVDTGQNQGLLLTAGQQTAVGDITSLAQAKEVLSRRFMAHARELGLDDIDGQLTQEEVFNVVRDGLTQGKIIEISMELTANVVARIKGGYKHWQSK